MTRFLSSLLLVALLAALLPTGDPGVARASDQASEPAAASRVLSVSPAQAGPAAGPSAEPAPRPAPEIAAAPEIILGESATRYASYGRLRGRAANVELAAHKLDGAVIEPGAVLSFNDRVGERSGDAGFRPAPVIASGRVRTGMGGGVCQVTSTLHAAALEAGLEVVEHRPHSRPSSYIDMGLDATVVWDRIDFKVRNPHPFPVVVSALAADGRVAVRVMGAEAAGDAGVETKLLRELPIREEIVQDPALASGVRVVDRQGRAGYVVRVVHTDGTGQRTVRRIRYDAVSSVVRVGALAAPAQG